MGLIIFYWKYKGTMSYLSEAFQFIVPKYQFDTNNAYIIVDDRYEINSLKHTGECEKVCAYKFDYYTNPYDSPILSGNSPLPPAPLKAKQDRRMICKTHTYCNKPDMCNK